MKRLADFDTSAAPTVSPTTIATLASGGYLDAGEPVVLLGESGTGKSHLLIGLGIAACEQGRRVRYLTTAQLVNELVEAADDRRLSRIVARYGRLDLLCLDEFGYVQLDRRGAELLFQVITEREEKASIATVSNLPFSEWGQIIPDPRLVAAIIDRVTFHAHIIETGTESYPTPRHPRQPLPQEDPATRWGQIKRARWGQSGLTFPPVIVRPVKRITGKFCRSDRRWRSSPLGSWRTGSGSWCPRHGRGAREWIGPFQSWLARWLRVPPSVTLVPST